MIMNNLKPHHAPGMDDEVYPRYHGQSIANLPYTIMDILGVKDGRKAITKELYKDHINTKGIKNVVLIVLDGLGYNMFLDANKTPGLLNKLSKKGVVMPITSVFPSTTAAALTTLNTGLTPLEHGLTEWDIYIDGKRTTFLSKGHRSMGGPKKGMKLYKGETIYQKLRKGGVDSYVIADKAFCSGIYNEQTRKGSKQISFSSLKEGASNLRRLVESSKGTSYMHLYIENINSKTHKHGPFSKESRKEIQSISRILQKNLLDKLDKKSARETLLIITADHGFATSTPTKTVHLNKDGKLRRLISSSNGSNLVPTGNPRSMFVHVSNKNVGAAHAHLKSSLSNANVMTSSSAVKMGLLGNGIPHSKLSERVGDILILPKEGHTVSHGEMESVPMGVHGGLSHGEMIVPLGMARLSDLL